MLRNYKSISRASPTELTSCHCVLHNLFGLMMNDSDMFKFGSGREGLRAFLALGAKSEASPTQLSVTSRLWRRARLVHAVTSFPALSSVPFPNPGTKGQSHYPVNRRGRGGNLQTTWAVPQGLVPRHSHCRPVAPPSAANPNFMPVHPKWNRAGTEFLKTAAFVSL